MELSTTEVSGLGPYTVELLVADAGLTPVDVDIDLKVASEMLSYSVRAVPEILFRGAESVISGDAQGQLFWSAATGGEAPLSYDVYLATTSGTQDFSAPTLANIPAEMTSATPTGLTNDTTYFAVVRAKDALGDDGNTKEVRFTPGTILYVDASAAAGGDGARATPFNTVAAALAQVAGGSGDRSIYVASGTYPDELPMTISPGLQLLGGVDPTSDWMPTGERSVFSSSSALTDPGALVNMGADASLSSFELSLSTGLTTTGSGSLIVITSSDNVSVSNLSLEPGGAIAALSISDSANARVSGVAIVGGSTTAACLGATNSSLQVIGGSFADCGTGLSLSGGALELAGTTITGGTDAIVGSSTALSILDAALTGATNRLIDATGDTTVQLGVMRSRLANAGNACISANGFTGAELRKNTFNDCNAALVIDAGSEERIAWEVLDNVVTSTVQSGSGIELDAQVGVGGVQIVATRNRIERVLEMPLSIDVSGRGVVEQTIQLEADGNTVLDSNGPLVLSTFIPDRSSFVERFAVAAQVIGNQIVDSDGGIDLQLGGYYPGSSTLRVSENTLSGGDSRLVVDHIGGLNHRTMVSNNEVSGSTTSDQVIDVSTRASIGTYDVEVIHNRIVTPANTGSTAFRIRGREWNGSGNRSGWSMAVVGNSVDGGQQVGMEIEDRTYGGVSRIDSNWVQGADTGIDVHSRASSNAIRDVYIRNNVVGGGSQAMRSEFIGLDSSSAPHRLNVVGNRLDASTEAISIRLDSTYGFSRVAASVAQNEMFGRLAVDMNDGNRLSTFSASIDNNIIESSGAGIALSMADDEFASTDFVVAGNQIACREDGIQLSTSGSTSALAFDAAANDILSGGDGIKVDTSFDGTINARVTGNTMDGQSMASGVVFTIDQTAAGSSEIAIENNVVSGGLTGAGIALDSPSSADRVRSNTVVSSTSGMVGVSVDAGTVVSNNIVQGTFATPLEGGAQSFNLLPAGFSATGSNLAGTPLFAAVPSFADWAISNTENMIDVADTTAYGVGQTVLVDFEVSARAVIAVDSNTVTLDGEPLPDNSVFNLFVFSEPTAAMTPSLRLTPESPGIDQGDPSLGPDLDGSPTDIGAFGGLGASELGRVP